MSKVLDGKVAIITGGSRGLGAVLAATLADQGADIAITYAASADKAESVAEVVRAKGVRALAIRCDQADMPVGCNAILAHATLPSTSSNLASCRPT